MLHVHNMTQAEARKALWRQKHESFVKTIREARNVQNVMRAFMPVRANHITRHVTQVLDHGGSLADLPPPPRDEHPEYVHVQWRPRLSRTILRYVSCPHCARRFDETVAQRHIPFCATQVHPFPMLPTAWRDVM